MTAAPQLASHVVVRANNLPLASLDALMESRQAERLLAQLHAATARLDALRPQACALLFALAAEGDGEYRKLVAAKRAIYGGDTAAAVLARHGALLARYAGLASWLHQARAVQQCEAELLALFERACEASRAAARGLIRHPGFLPGLAMSRGQVYRVAMAYADSAAVSGKKALNDEETLFRYLSRAIVKVSPFSSFTSVGFAPLRQDGAARIGLPAAQATQDRFSLDRSALLKLFERFLLRHHGHWRFRLTGNSRAAEGAHYYYLFDERPEAYPYRTSFSKTRFANAALFAADDGQPGWLRWDDIARRLPPGCDAPALLRKWVTAGVLDFQPRLDEESAQPLHDFLAIARAVARSEAAAQPVAAVLEEMAQAFGQLQSRDPARLLTQAGALQNGLETLSRLLDWPLVKTGGLVYHDSYLPGVAPLSEPLLRHYGGQIGEFVAHYLGNNFSSGYSDAVLASLRAALADGRSLPVFEFYELVQQTVAAHAGAPRVPEEKTLRLLALYDQIWARRAEREIVLAPAPVAAPAPAGASASASAWARGGAFAAYGHLTAEGFVLNNIDSGYLRCYSRFFTFAPGSAILDDCRAAYGSELEQAYDVYDTFGFNTAYRPRICRHRIWLHAAPAAQWRDGDLSLSALEVSWPAHAPLPQLTAGPERRPLRLRQTGLFVKELYPRLLEMLMRFSMADAPSYFAFRFGLHKMVSEAGRGGVLRIPRIRYRDIILSREQWWLDRDRLPQRAAGEDAAAYFLRLNAWRREHGLPQRVFLRRHLASKVLERDVSNSKKPVLLDFAAPIMARMIGRLFGSAFDQASLEEMLPDGGDRHASRAGQPYASELLFDVNPGSTL